jgi:hypothetical protein
MNVEREVLKRQHGKLLASYEEFCRWFAPITAGPKDNYAAVAAEIWILWCADPIR